mmetsp:Transcript_22481/g.62728  ORF Transcript_22481/g.62728 Transcript_22481/m.62728 type:complete len:335 (+) Transcript_22481:1102-2106(+)
MMVEPMTAWGLGAISKLPRAEQELSLRQLPRMMMSLPRPSQDGFAMVVPEHESGVMVMIASVSAVVHWAPSLQHEKPEPMHSAVSSAAVPVRKIPLPSRAPRMAVMALASFLMVSKRAWATSTSTVAPPRSHPRMLLTSLSLLSGSDSMAFTKLVQMPMSSSQRTCGPSAIMELTSPGVARQSVCSGVLLMVGAAVGSMVGPSDGRTLGKLDGPMDGSTDGRSDGLSVGVRVGPWDGSSDGRTDGMSLMSGVGAKVGHSVGRSSRLTQKMTTTAPVGSPMPSLGHARAALLMTYTWPSGLGQLSSTHPLQVSVPEHSSSSTTTAVTMRSLLAKS